MLLPTLGGGWVASTAPSISCSPTLIGRELTPLRSLDPDSSTTNSPSDPAPSAQDPWQEGQDPWSANSSGSKSSGSTLPPTEPKNLCNEDVREQTDRSALVLQLAPPSAMTPVIHLSPEANAMVAAINGALAPRLDGIQGQMGWLAGSKGRSCELDVCWEGEKFRVICVHVNPRSVIHSMREIWKTFARWWYSARKMRTVICVWTPSLGWGPIRLGQEAVTLVQLQQLHIVPKNRDYSSASSWNTCSLSQTHSETTTTERPTHSHAITAAVMNRNRSTTSYHLTPAYVLGPWTHRSHGSGSLVIDSYSCFRTKENTRERDRQEANRMGMPWSRSFQQRLFE